MASVDKVLVIDDDDAVCQIVTAVARTMDLDCISTKDPSTFPALVTPDISLILLDLMMPGMDGIEVLRRLGQLHCKARILLMSGMDKRVLESAERLAQSLRLPIVGHLKKPISLEELQENLGAFAGMALPEMNTEHAPMAIPDEEIRSAIGCREFVNFYQPQVSVSTGQVMGVEALARWRHPELGLVLPDNFITRVDALGLIDELFWTTAELALAEARQFIGRNGEVLRLSLNASMNSLYDLDFPDELVSLAQKHGFPVEKLAIEITESGLIKELSHTLDVLTRLRMKNIQLAIDDFGTGYAMMRQLQNVPATELKIDKSIIEKMHLNDSDHVMVAKIVEMGHELGAEVLAEGVVLREQFELLRAMKCDGAQGFLFSPPLPAEEMEKFLVKFNTRPPY